MCAGSAGGSLSCAVRGEGAEVLNPFPVCRDFLFETNAVGWVWFTLGWSPERWVTVEGELYPRSMQRTRAGTNGLV